MNSLFLDELDEYFQLDWGGTSPAELPGLVFLGFSQRRRGTPVECGEEQDGESPSLRWSSDEEEGSAFPLTTNRNSFRETTQK